MSEKTLSWGYIKSEPGLWTVGYYDPSGNWQSDSDHDSPHGAAERVAYLNGNMSEGYPGIAHDFETCKRQNQQLVAALEEIAKGEGEFSRDPLEFATNVIESMKRIATAALQSAKSVSA